MTDLQKIESNVEVISFSALPDKYDYTKEDFTSPDPYEALYKLISNKFVFQAAVERMSQNATEVGFKGFRKMLSQYMKSMQEAKRRYLIPNQTEFDEQELELDCGEWVSTDTGIYRDTPMGGREVACTHAIMPVKRLVNIDTGEVKMELAYKRAGARSKWRTTIVENSVISKARDITSLASQGISITSNSASALVDYLNCISERNYDIIPESKSIGRLGYIPGEGFSPYVDGLVFDGDACYRNMYQSIQSHGSQTEWYRIALECRKMSVTARIILAASFASPLLSVVGSLPFFVHLWGGTETGKTVALMLAASVWGDPELGSFTQTFNATQVGQERTAAFLNHLPMCIDELQLTLNSRGQTSFDVYQLAQGVGRARGKRSGGVEMTPTWKCCFLSTGESPITSTSSGGGAVNRVIDIECITGSTVITDGPRIASALKQNYGFAGQIFVEKLYENDKVRDIVQEIYNDNVKELRAGDSTEKQAMAAAAIITADQIATAWIFKDNNALTADDIRGFLASKEAVSAGRRAYEWLCDWVSANENKFLHDEHIPNNDVYGMIDGNVAFINPSVFKNALTDASFSPSATLSYLRSNCLIETSKPNEYTKPKRIGRSSKRYVWLHLAVEYEDRDEGSDEEYL